MNIPIIDFKSAVSILLSGGVIIYPTETFFAIGCMVTNFEAIARVYQAKCRDINLALPVLGGNRAQLNSISIIHEELEPLLNIFWPGALTLVVPSLPKVPASVTVNSGTIALRLCSHDIAIRLCEMVGEALISSSANISGHKAVSRVEELDCGLIKATDGVLCEGMRPMGGLPSTIVQRESNGSLKILREGIISSSEISKLGFRITRNS